MRHLMLVLAIALGGCTCGIDYVKDAADTVNREAFGGQLHYTISFKTEPGVAADYHATTQQIHLHPDWIWQGWIFVEGIIAHEMIHAYLELPCPGVEEIDDETAAEAPDVKTLHGYKFWKTRREVAEKLGIPTWAIPTGRKRSGTRLDMYWTCQYLEGRIQAMRMQARGAVGFVIVPK